MKSMGNVAARPVGGSAHGQGKINDLVDVVVPHMRVFKGYAVINGIHPVPGVREVMYQAILPVGLGHEIDQRVYQVGERGGVERSQHVALGDLLIHKLLHCNRVLLSLGAIGTR